jgi:hypothetical protein
MSRVIESVIMPGGWHKPEKDRLGRDGITVRADTYRQLIAAIIKFRSDNIIPIGNVESELESWLCETYPHMCHQVYGAEVSIFFERGPSPIQEITDKLLQWLDSRIRDHSVNKLELQSEARRRAEICCSCQYNVNWNSNCGTCSEAVNRMSTILRFGNDVHGSDKLKACQLLGHENRAAIWLKNENVGSSPDLPNFCWARK